MSTEKNYIVAIEIGSSKVTGIAGRKEPDGALHVVAAVQKPSSDFIRKGRINNQLKTLDCITDIKQRLERVLKKNIQQAYVGVGGMGMHAQINIISRNFPEKQLITEEIIEEMREENAQRHAADKIILATIPQEYHLGAQTTTDPIGISSDNIEARFLNIITRKEVCDNIDKCFTEAKLGVAGKPITFLALAEDLLEEQKRRSGCVFVDMGAETTSVAVFKNNVIQHVAVIPLGGDNITRDISSLQVDMQESERLKLKYGVAVVPENADGHEDIALPMNNKVTYETFCELVEARQEEIVRNVAEQIKISGLDREKLIGGIVLTGGASQMKDIDKAFSIHTGFEREKVSFVYHIKTQLRATGTLADFNKDGSYNSAIAVLESGEEICCGDALGDNKINFEPNQEAEEKAIDEIRNQIAEIEELLTRKVKKEQPITDAINALETLIQSKGKEKDFAADVANLRSLLAQKIEEAKAKKGGMFKGVKKLWNKVEEMFNEED